MEESVEKSTTNVLNAINPKKKGNAAAPKKTLSKDEEATAKVEQLLKNTSVAGLVKSEPAKSEFDIEDIKQEKTSKWMEEQIDLLNKQVEEQENELMFYKNEVEKLQAILQSGGGIPQGNEMVLANNGTLSPEIVNLFRHFESVYENGFTDAKIVHPESGQGLLDMMLQFFPQLENVRRYRYRGQGR